MSVSPVQSTPVSPIPPGKQEEEEDLDAILEAALRDFELNQTQNAKQASPLASIETLSNPTSIVKKSEEVRTGHSQKMTKEELRVLKDQAKKKLEEKQKNKSSVKATTMEQAEQVSLLDFEDLWAQVLSEVDENEILQQMEALDENQELKDLCEELMKGMSNFSEVEEDKQRKTESKAPSSFWSGLPIPPNALHPEQHEELRFRWQKFAGQLVDMMAAQMIEGMQVSILQYRENPEQVREEFIQAEKELKEQMEWGSVASVNEEENNEKILNDLEISSSDQKVMLASPDFSINLTMAQIDVCSRNADIFNSFKENFGKELKIMVFDKKAYSLQDLCSSQGWSKMQGQIFSPEAYRKMKQETKQYLLHHYKLDL